MHIGPSRAGVLATAPASDDGVIAAVPAPASDADSGAYVEASHVIARLIQHNSNAHLTCQ